jgi:hypothetical protein
VPARITAIGILMSRPSPSSYGSSHQSTTVVGPSVPRPTSASYLVRTTTSDTPPTPIPGFPSSTMPETKTSMETRGAPLRLRAQLRWGSSPLQPSFQLRLRLYLRSAMLGLRG